MYRVYKLLLRALVGVFMFSPLFVFAQYTQEYQGMLNALYQNQQQVLDVASGKANSTADYLDIKINPTNPAPNVPVSISIESYLTDLYKANISWSLNGIVELRGMGKTSYTFQNGPAGATTLVSLTIITNTAEVITKNFSFSPVGVTILWEADTYTPPFYKGKALMVPQANVRIVAIPNTSTVKGSLDSSNLVYTWKKDDYVIANASGLGKNVFSFTGPKPLTPLKVSLSVSSLNDTAQSDINIYLPQKQPFILFYEKDPLLGVLYNKPFGSTFSLNKKELSVSAEPYFFSNQHEEAQTLKYTWLVNGSATPNYGRFITLRNDSGQKGSSLVALSMRGLLQNYQTADKKVQINFAESGSTSRPIF